MSFDFLIDRNDLRNTRLAPTPSLGEIEVAPGEIVVAVDTFALTANNVTYAVYGDAMSYWSFFPGPDGWGRLPVWGFADVVQSRHEAIYEGERLYGYFPISTFLVMSPGRVTEGGFTDETEHRRALPVVYNRYSRVAGDPGYDPGNEDLQMILHPLFMTSFMLDDFLREHEFFGADAVIMTSASSKTALGLAFSLARHGNGPEVVGLTSPGNIDFVTDLGWHDRVVGYDDVPSALSTGPSVLVDFAGNVEMLSSLHRHLGDNVAYSCLVGGAHWEERGAMPDVPGARPTFFFAPSQIKKRAEEWGAGGIEQRSGEVWRAFVEAARSILTVRKSSGPDNVRKVYLDLVDGAVSPGDGHILSLAD